MTIHELKCWPEPFQALMDGRKTCEWRKDDRGYQEGDTLHLMEYEPGHAGEIPDRSYYTSRTLDVLVADIQRGPSWGIPEGYCMMSVQLGDSHPLIADRQLIEDVLAATDVGCTDGGFGATIHEYSAHDNQEWPVTKAIAAWLQRNGITGPVIQRLSSYLEEMERKRKAEEERDREWAKRRQEARTRRKAEAAAPISPEGGK